MTISVNYQKRKNTNLFKKLQQVPSLNLQNTQNYIPIYSKFFALNANNWNSINLNHPWYFTDIKEPHSNAYSAKVKYIHDDSMEVTRPVFIKLAPLLDPTKYIVGRYNHEDPNLFTLPSLDAEACHPKVHDCNNASFVDGFFAYLTSQLLHTHKMIHGIDYYGSFLAIKPNYKINVIDELDSIIQSTFFNNNKGKLFQIDDYSHLLLQSNGKQLNPIKISPDSLKSALSVKSLNCDIFEDIFEDTLSSPPTDSNLVIHHLEDLTNVEFLPTLKPATSTTSFANTNSHSKTEQSTSSCSSRTSHTKESESLSDYDDADDDDGETDDDENNKDESNTNDDEYDVKNEGEDKHDDDGGDDDGNWSDMSSAYEEQIFVTFPKFPVQVICTERCDTTLDELIVQEKINEEEIFSALMQVIMTLLVYQKTFAFTHNDLHTNNIMCVSTNIKFIYYMYKKKIYKVPTFGRIYKIIDFGRAIYKFNNKLFSSDSFQQGGDASSQYNTEPFFNEKKPRIDPNYSFDLCRLACSIFDYIVDDFDAIKTLQDCSPLVRLIVEWCIDDNGINVLYKNNGIERYPGFKLYKMIARCVHNHTPQAQLERPEFQKYLVKGNKLPTNECIIDIDSLPSYI